MDTEKSLPPERLREALNRIYDEVPGHIRDYLRRYREDPSSRVFAPLAEAYRRMGRLEEAIDVCVQGIKYHPDFIGGKMALARCYMDKKMWLQAKQTLSAILSQSPENLMAQRSLSETYLALDDRSKALHHLKMASLLSPNDVSLNERVFALSKEVEQEKLERSKFEEAHLHQETATTEQVVAKAIGESVSGTDNLSHVAESELGVEAFFGKESEEEPFKIEHVSRIFSNEGDSEITTETLGDLYFTQGQFQRSLSIFERLAQYSPSLTVAKKLDACREKLGVDKNTLIRNRKIEALQSVLLKLKETRGSQ